METSLPADTGFYYKFESDPVTGKPSGCPALDGDWNKGKGFSKSMIKVNHDSKEC